MKKIIYCISGLGTDENIFSGLQIDGYRLQYLPWLRPHPDESVQAYAARMAAPITETLPIVLGVSFGGMIAIEIAKKITLRKIIILSGVKSDAELPLWMKVSGKLQLNKLIPIRHYPFLDNYNNKRQGIITDEEKKLANYYRKNADLYQVKWAVHQIINWKSSWYPENLVQIHGEQDAIFPVKNIQSAYIIKEGTHMMLVNKAKEISHIINEVLKNEKSQ